MELQEKELQKDWSIQEICLERTPGLELAIPESRFEDRPCLFADQFKQFFGKFSNQNFPSITIFVFKETRNVLFTL